MKSAGRSIRKSCVKGEGVVEKISFLAHHGGAAHGILVEGGPTTESAFFPNPWGVGLKSGLLQLLLLGIKMITEKISFFAPTNTFF